MVFGPLPSRKLNKADTDMGMNVIAVGRYYSHFFNPVEFARDTKDIVTTGETRPRNGKAALRSYAGSGPDLPICTR